LYLNYAEIARGLNQQTGLDFNYTE
jgi:hypothetical protein